MADACPELYEICSSDYLNWAEECRLECGYCLWGSNLVSENAMLASIAMTGAAWDVKGQFWAEMNTRRKGEIPGDANGNACNDCNTPMVKQQRALMHERMDCWQYADIRARCNGRTGRSAVDVIVENIQDWTIGVREELIKSTLLGLYRNNLADCDGDLVFDACDAEVNPNWGDHYNCKVFNAATKRFGCHRKDITATLVHSDVACNMENTGELTRVAPGRFIRNQCDCEDVPIMGSALVIECDDELLIDEATGKYINILFKPGAIQFGDGEAEVPFESDRNACQDNGAGGTEWYARERFIIHPNGWTACWEAPEDNPNIVSPTCDELQDGTVYKRCCPAKGSPIMFTLTAG